MNLENLDLSLLQTYGFEEEYRNGEVIFNEGDECKNLGIILEGEAKIITYTYQDKEEVITNLNKGDLFGQFVLFSKHNNYVGTCIALRKTKILFLTKSNFLKITRSDDKFLLNYLEEISEISYNLKQQAKLFAHKNIRDRIMFYIKIYNEYGIVKYKSITDLSNILNIPRPSLSRELIKMQNEGIISYTNHYIRYENRR